LAGLLRLSVITPDQVLLQVDEATRVRLRLADLAWLSIYPNHAPLVAEVLPGPVQYDTELEAGEIELGSAILYVDSNVVTILTSGHRERTDVEGAGQTGEALRFDRLAREVMLALRAQDEMRHPEEPWFDGFSSLGEEG
jgi:F0F1-type ATP synthase epsilon subunit